MPHFKTNDPQPRVSIRANRDRLLLAWKYEGKKYTLYLGLKDTKVNRLNSRDTILQIEADIEANCLDTSLTKYKPHKGTGKPISDLTCSELYQDWLNHKSIYTDQRNIEWLKCTLTDLNKHLKVKVASRLTRRDTELFFTQLKSTGLKPETIKRKLENLKACWQWAIENNLLTDNPWVGLSKLIKVPSKAMPRPFTKDEMNRILEWLERHPRYCLLTPFVRFLFATGVRTGEAIGLRYSDLSEDYSCITISEQLTRGVRKTTKTGKVRTIYLTPILKDLLIALKHLYKPSDPDTLIFQWNNKPIDLNRFRRCVWEPLLNDLDIPYRTVYNTRHTFISHALEQGMNPVVIAQITGHDVNVLFNHYAGSLHNKPMLPDI